mmetsp:Transcript_2203/g.4953  ORF Transcript_2203/g.4953 Transcript_2203/m.4953 type:complete len:268 (-) Transcript_2203:1851-2654(-)
MSFFAGPLRYLKHEVGFWLRETGLSLDRMGMRMRGDYSFRDALNRHRTIMPVALLRPIIGNDVFVAPNALVAGEVTLGDKASVWYGASVRGDCSAVEIGKGTNIQDHATIITFADLVEKPGSVMVGEDVTIGHGALLRPGVRVGDAALIGINAVLLENSIIGKNAMVAAHALVASGTEIPEGELWAGNPAKMLRKLTPEEIAALDESAAAYRDLAQTHIEALGITPDHAQALELREKIVADRDEYFSETSSTAKTSEHLPKANPGLN